MKIAYIIPSLANKGPIIVVKDLIDALIKQGHTCQVFYFDNIVDITFNCTTTRIKFNTPIHWNQFDIIHTHMFRPDLYALKLSLKKTIRKKLITTIHNFYKQDLRYNYSKFKTIIASLLWRLAWKRFNKVVVLSQVAKDYYSKIINPHKIKIIYNGRGIDHNKKIDTEDEAFFQQLKNKNLTIIGTVASFNKRKGLEQIIKLLVKEQKYVFIVVGDGAEAQNLTQKAIQLKVRDRFFILGNKPLGYRYINQFDIFAIPSRSEGLPLALLEAAALKIPIICSDIEIFKEVFPTNAASFFQLDNIDSIQKSIHHIQQNKKDFIQNAFYIYQEKYSVTVMAREYQNLYYTSNPNHQ